MQVYPLNAWQGEICHGTCKENCVKHVKRATESERERFKYQMYRDDLSSGAAESVNRDLEDLNLPKLGDCKQQFESTARELGIR